MNAHALSINQLKYIENLSPDYKSVLDTIVSYAGRYGVVTLSQPTLASMHSLSLRTISTIMKYFRALGLIQVKHRWKTSNETVLGDIFIQPEFRSHLFKLFPQFPTKEKVILSLSLLKSSVAFHFSKIVLRNVLSYVSGYRRPHMKGELITKMRGIALALRERGATLTNEDALALFAFEESLHDKVIQKIKTVQVEHPAAFYFAHIRELAVWEKSPINWQLVEQLRDEGFVLLKEEVKTVKHNVKPTEKKEKVVSHTVQPTEEEDCPTELYDENDSQVTYVRPSFAKATADRATPIKTQKREDRKVPSFAESTCRAVDIDCEKEKELAREILRKNIAENPTANNIFAAMLMGVKV